MDIIRAILYKIPDAKFSLMGDRYADINWLDSRPIPTEVELQTAFDELTALEIDPLKFEDWQGLWNRLQNSTAIIKCNAQAKTSLRIFFAYYKFEQAVITVQKKSDLKTTLDALRVEMGSLMSVDDIAEINLILKKKGFKIKLV